MKYILCKLFSHKLPKKKWRKKTSNKCTRCGSTIWSKI